MTDPRDIFVAGFCTGAAFIGALTGWFGPAERTNNGLWNKQQRRDRARGRDPDWRRSFNHENTNRPTSEPPLRLQRTVRLDEGRVQRGGRSGAGYQPKPQIDPKGQRRTPNPPPSDP
jgi:hypothetical protein